MLDPSLRLGGPIATFALAQDNFCGQSLESQLRSCLLAKQIADRLSISPKTADHVQHIYTKIGVSTRAAALWAMQNGVVS